MDAKKLNEAEQHIVYIEQVAGNALCQNGYPAYMIHVHYLFIHTEHNPDAGPKWMKLMRRNEKLFRCNLYLDSGIILS